MIKSKKGKGTIVEAVMAYNHIERKTMGNICDTIMALIGTSGNEIDFLYEHCKNKRCFRIDTKEIKESLDDVPINNPEVIKFLRHKIKKEFKNAEKI